MAGKPRPVIKLSDEERTTLQDEISQYFLIERGEDLGIIASGQILDFFLETLGSRIYDSALSDARTWLRERMEGIESDYYSLFRD